MGPLDGCRSTLSRPAQGATIDFHSAISGIFGAETGSYLTGGRQCSRWVLLSVSAADTRKVSVPMCSEIGGNSADISKGILQSSISRFESCHPSQPVLSRLGVSGFSENARHFRRLARGRPVSAAENSACSGFAGDFFARVSGREISIAKFSGRESILKRGDRFVHDALWKKPVG